jgi:small redox-active disulfide protein 2
MEIKVYGPGCQNCVKLANNVEKAVEETGVDAKIVKVEDMADIAKAGVMSTPALGIDDDVKIKGRVAKKDEIKELIK